MTEPRTLAGGRGGFGTTSTFGSLDGWTLAEADDSLSAHPELRRRSITEHGYRHYVFVGGSELWIRPNGQVIRIPFPIHSADGQPIKGFRINIVTGGIVRSNVWHELPRDEHEWVVMDDSTD